MKIPEIPLEPKPRTSEARAALGFKWNDSVGHRHKLGGEPEWLQPAAVPRCSSCTHEMAFYAQLDSVGDELVLADCGMIYVFVCFDCFTTSAVLQSS
jgi:hypothetical protein